MYLDDRPFTTSALTAAAGCEPMTFRTWRNRNGLFPETAGDRKWKRFTVVDVCIVRVIVAMTAHGLSASHAIPFAQDNLRGTFERLLTGDRDTCLVGFFIGGIQNDELTGYYDEGGNFQIAKTKDRPEASHSFIFLDDAVSLSEAMFMTKGILTVIDLKALAQQVIDFLDGRGV
ncbi:MerR family transcriptional regulator [Methylorubrum thiocyanatum]|uniref:MerR family transcriptional regulator n=1 Tax=Methylorubrum thiocyanatum TaxID=47958 RepID=UPI003F7FEDD7